MQVQTNQAHWMLMIWLRPVTPRILCPLEENTAVGTLGLSNCRSKSRSTLNMAYLYLSPSGISLYKKTAKYVGKGNVHTWVIFFNKFNVYYSHNRHSSCTTNVYNLDVYAGVSSVCVRVPCPYGLTVVYKVSPPLNLASLDITCTEYKLNRQ